ncbi:hypothetical protein JHK82_022284 [Glycine max]|nr:hypothetical protein JHK82_022284 [Glycine max]
MQEELLVQVPNEDLECVRKLNNDQLIAFNAIMDVIHTKQSQVFFVDGSGGTRKTFLYHTLIASLRSEDVDSFCLISKQCNLAKLVRETTTIIWDEEPMTNRYALKALYRSLKDILVCDAPFGGKVMVLRGDFSQILPIVQKGTKAQMIFAYHNFVEYLMCIKDSIEPTNHGDMVKIPHQLEITWERESPIQKLIQETFPQLESHTWDPSYVVKGDTHNLYEHEYLHSIAPVGLPSHVLKVKKSAPLFPAKLSFAITINKSHGQAIPNVGTYLPRRISSHGQLHVAVKKCFSSFHKNPY